MVNPADFRRRHPFVKLHRILSHVLVSPETLFVNIWHNAPSLKTLAELNDWLELRCKDLWQEISHPEDPSRKVADVWADDCKVLMAVSAPFDG